MAINPKTVELTGLDLETARAAVAQLQLSPTVDDNTKLLAAAVTQAGAEIALALERHASSE